MLNTLLVPLDGSAISEQALPGAARIARAAHARVEIVFVRQPVLFDDPGDAAWQSHMARRDQEYVDTMARKLAEQSSVEAEGVVRQGSPAVEICARATEISAGLIVMTTNGRTGVSTIWIGSVARAVLRRSATPVLLLRPIDRTARIPRERRVESVLVTVDGSAMSEAIIEPACELALAFEAHVELLRIVEPVQAPHDSSTRHLDEAKAYLATIAKRFDEKGVKRVDPHVVVADHAATAILDFAQRAEPSAVAMATHGRGVSRFFLGSVSDKILHATHAPLLLCRPASLKAQKGGDETEADSE
jgi:nucleotide-binding universal stress UspA family protein